MAAQAASCEEFPPAIQALITEIRKLHREEKLLLIEEIRNLRQQVEELTKKLTPESVAAKNSNDDEEEDAASHTAKRKLSTSDEEENMEEEASSEDDPDYVPVKRIRGTSATKKTRPTTDDEPQAGPSTEATPPPQPEVASATRPPKPPPITLPKSKGYSEATKLADSLKIPIYANGSPDTRIFTQTKEDFKLLRGALEKNNIAYHTFSLKEERNLKVVLRGVPETLTEEEIKEDLTHQGFQFQSVKRLKNKQKIFPLVLVNGQRNDDGKRIFECNEVMKARITTEPKK